MKIRKFLHLIYIPFTGVGLYGGYRGDEWFKSRIQIFKDFTLKSLVNQEEKNFVVWASFRSQDKHNPLVSEIANVLKINNIEYILTFDGLMYWDDKFSKEWIDRIWNCGRVVRGCWRNNTWKDLIPSILEILYNEKNSTLNNRIQNSVNKIRAYFSEVEIIYMTRIDSDDMFSRKMISTIQKISTYNTVKAFVVKTGYIYNKDTNELAYYHPKKNPPFHTIIFPSNIFFNGNEHLKYYNGYKSHEDVTRVFIPYFILPDYMYCVLTHNPKNQISTVFSHPFKGETIKDSMKKKEILKEFGL